MDALDMRILRALGQGPFENGPRHPDSIRPAQLATALGTTRQTVEARLAKMEEAGILTGYTLHPNLRHLGLQWAVYHWCVANDAVKKRAFEAISPGYGIEAVYTFLGPDVCTVHYWRDEAERDAGVKTVRAVVGLGEPQEMYARLLPATRHALTNLDWRIVRALRADARRPLEDVAREVGVSTRTIKRRFDRMAGDNAFDVVASVALEKAPRSIPLAFLFHFAPDAGKGTAAALMRAFDDRCLSAWVPPSTSLGNYDMTILAETTGEIDALRDRALAVPGVVRVEILLYTAGRRDGAWLDAAIARKIEETARAPLGPDAG